MKIGELSARSGVQVETIRYYEAQGLLQAAARASNNYRDYDEGHAARLAFIQRCRSLDLSQADIRGLITLQDEPSCGCERVDDVLDRHLAQVSARIAELQALREELERIRHACAAPGRVADCRALASLNFATAVGPDASLR
ncbi:Cd(II)/Pb(II)-responsive transcriptional regulator [Niveibacterium sp. SC-1]|uniref:Cd(II)/Pb(II)-responsive transcriptional regulator n=1 Tax=Niveibacterium sp. SC-1 TaxID=3135646 RepID=UPI00311D8B0F